MRPVKEVSFLQAMREFFEPEDIIAFNDEIADLSDKDREEFRQLLIASGYKISPLHLLLSGPKRDMDDGVNYELLPKVTPQFNGYAVGQVHPAMMAK